MIRTNNAYGIMSLHYANERKKPKNLPDPPTVRQWTPEEMIRYQSMMPAERKDKYKTTARQRPVNAENREIDIWNEKE